MQNLNIENTFFVIILTCYGPDNLYKVNNKNMNVAQSQDPQWYKSFLFPIRKIFEVIVWFHLYKKTTTKKW